MERERYPVEGEQADEDRTLTLKRPVDRPGTGVAKNVVHVSNIYKHFPLFTLFLLTFHFIYYHVDVL